MTTLPTKIKVTNISILKRKKKLSRDEKLATKASDFFEDFYTRHPKSRFELTEEKNAKKKNRSLKC